MGIQSARVKSSAKRMISGQENIQKVVLETLKTCSDLVGATLGPGGRSVIIEPSEINMPPIVTKDGVTVFRSLAFMDSTKQLIMETTRDASMRTAADAGDGTTSATILSESFVRQTQEYCRSHPHVSPQRVVRAIQRLFKEYMSPVIEAMAVRPSLGTPEGREVLRGVAKVSANGDEELADAVLACFDVIGDEGNVTLTEAAGPSKYLVQRVEGYPIPIGYEDSCGFAANKFVNDIGTQSCVMENPVFLLYFGKITDFNSLWPIIQTVTEAVNSGTEVKGHKVSHNFVVAATGFTEDVLANLAVQFPAEGMINVYPLRVPMAPVKSGTYDFLLDLAAITGGAVFDAIEKPLQNFSVEDLGIGPRMFEATRFRSSVIGHLDGDLVLARVDQIQKQLGEVAVSELEKNLLRERLAKITSGIARLIVQGSSHGEIKERRDRAEDAICAVRGAIKHGALPGGGVCLAALSAGLSNIGTSHPEMGEGTAEIASAVASQALLEPVRRLYSNAGYSPDETSAMIERLSELETFDLYNERWVSPQEEGLLDSLPAVKEAIRNAISVAASAGTCGGIISFPRDLEMERDEARDTADFLRHAGINEANERA